MCKHFYINVFLKLWKGDDFWPNWPFFQETLKQKHFILLKTSCPWLYLLSKLCAHDSWKNCVTLCLKYVIYLCFFYICETVLIWLAFRYTYFFRIAFTFVSHNYNSFNILMMTFIEYHEKKYIFYEKLWNFYIVANSMSNSLIVILPDIFHLKLSKT